jgi:hypothetical protein
LSVVFCGPIFYEHIKKIVFWYHQEICNIINQYAFMLRSNVNLIFHLFYLFTLSLLANSCAVQPDQPIPAFLPMADSVPRSEAAADIDGIWRISTIGKDIRIEGGRAYAVDGWLHLMALHIQPNMVVIRNIKPDGMGGYTGEDLPLMGKWQAKPAADGALDVNVAGVMGPANYRLIPVELDNTYPKPGEEDNGNIEDDPDEKPRPMPIPSPPDPLHRVGNSITEIGRNCYHDWKPMGTAMLKYYACHQGLGSFNGLSLTLKAKNQDDAKAVFAASACKKEFNTLVNTARRKGFKSISLGISGELAAIIGGSGESFIATNLDLSNSTLYGSVGASLGTQAGGSANGVVSVYLDPADRLSGKGKSFSVSLKALGGAGGAVGLSPGSSPTCESFSAIGGVGLAANAGSVSTTRTFKLIRFHKPDFTAACKNVTVRARNLNGKEIKIIDVDFYDYINKRWRSKVIKNRIVKRGKAWSKTLRLQKVGGDKTKVKVQYRVKTGRGLFNRWSKVLSRESRVQNCKNGATFAVDL